jgi:putative oxidoreductase
VSAARAQFDRLGLVIVRVMVGALFVAHGSPKIAAAFHDPRLPEFAASLHRLGMNPGVVWAWVVTVVEFFGGICLVTGVYARLAAALIAVEMIVAGTKVNFARGFYWTKGGWEVPLIFAVLCVVLVLTVPRRSAHLRATGAARRRTTVTPSREEGAGGRGDQ